MTRVSNAAEDPWSGLELGFVRSDDEPDENDRQQEWLCERPRWFMPVGRIGVAGGGPFCLLRGTGLFVTENVVIENLAEK
jgi:hypothetical protein